MEEEIQSKEYDWHLMKRLLVYLRPYRWRIFGAFLLMLSIAAFQILTPYLVKVAIDNYVTKHDLPGLNNIALLFLLVLVLQMFLSYLQVYVMQMTGQSIMYDMRVQIFSHLQKL